MNKLLKMYLCGLVMGLPIISAATPIDVIINPTFRSVLEGDQGTFAISFKNTGVNDVRIDDISSLGPATPTIFFVGGDRNDEVFDWAFENTANCIGQTLQQNDACTFQLRFFTRDLNPALSDTNTGLWRISNLTWAGIETVGTDELPTSDIFSCRAGEFLACIEVRDPGASSEIPEPIPLSMLGIGLVTMLMMRARRQG